VLAPASEAPLVPDAPIPALPALPALRFWVVVSVVEVLLVGRVVDWHPAASTASDRLSKMMGRVLILRGINKSS